MIWLFWSTPATVVILTWFLGRPSRGLFSASHWVTNASAEIHPFVPFLFLANLAVNTWGEPPGSRWVSYAITVWIIVDWFRDRDDDDRWKRRRRKLGGRVRSLGHRLVAVPEGSS